MAKKATSTEPYEGGEGEGLSVSDALKLYEDYAAYWNDIYDEARTDLNFALGIGHWSDADVKARRDMGKPTLTINQLPQFIHQVTNDIRQNTPSIKIIPELDADEETSEVYAGIIRATEYKSKAEACYNTASDYSVRASIGFVALDHDYMDDDSEEQEIKIETVQDPLSVFLDPASVEYDGSDANCAIRLKPISRKDFEKQFPDSEASSFVEPDNDKANEIVLGEVFVREWTGKRGKKAIIKRYLFSGKDRLKDGTFPGKYIPLIPFVGEMVWVNGKRYIYSLIRQARDPQKRLNHWASKEAEILSMAPIAPVMAEQGSLVNNRRQWQSPGTEMVLEYKATIDGRPVNRPERLQPPPIPTGVINAMQGAKENIKESMGMYAASLGNRSNVVSGVAYNAQKQEGDVATFHFADNARRSISHVGTVIVSMIPEVIDTPRALLTINEEAANKMVGVNGAIVGDQERSFDLTKGQYHVRVTTGTSYTTRRQEAAAMFGDLINKRPDLLQVIGDIWAKNLDIPGSEALESRLSKIIPQNLKEDENAPDPQVMQLQHGMEQAKAVIGQLQQENQQLAEQLKSKQAESEAKLMTAQVGAHVEQIKAQAQVQESQVELEIKQLEAEIKKEELLIKQAELMLKRQQIVAPVQYSEG